MLKHLNLQLLAEPAAGDPGSGGGQPPAATPTQPASVTFNADQMAAIDKIALERSERASKSALTSYFQQQGMTEEQAAEAIKSYKTAKASELSPEAVAQIAAERSRADNALKQANSILVQADARIQAASIGVRPDRLEAVLGMTKLGEISVQDGKVDTAATKKALEAVLAQFPEWKAESAAAPGFKVGGDGTNNSPGADDAALRRAFGLSEKK